MTEIRPALTTEEKQILRAAIPGWQDWEVDEQVLFFASEDSPDVFAPSDVWMLVEDGFIVGMTSGVLEDGKRFVCYHPITRQAWGMFSRERWEDLLRKECVPPREES
jgi:hypothetical protein